MPSPFGHDWTQLHMKVFFISRKVESRVTEEENDRVYLGQLIMPENKTNYIRMAQTWTIW